MHVSTSFIFCEDFMPDGSIPLFISLIILISFSALFSATETAYIVITVLVLIFGEITPKYIGKACAENFAMLVYPIIKILIFIFYPLNMIFSLWKKLITKIFHFDSKNVITEEEIITMVEEAEEDGTIKEHETNLIRSVIEFDDLDAEDIIVPRVNICAIEKTASKEEIKSQFEKNGFSRLPVYDSEIDSVIGIFYMKKIFIKRIMQIFQLKKLSQNLFLQTER